MKKQRSMLEVTCADSGRWFGNRANDGQIAVSITWTHCPP